MPTPRRVPTGAADRVFSCRLTTAEHEALDAAARAGAVKPGELFRSWIASGARLGPRVGGDSPPTFVCARERPGETVEIWSRWTPRHVWTLHRVPGRLDGPPLAVRRRLLRTDGAGGFIVETPGGDLCIDEDEFAISGHEQSSGQHRLDERIEPGPAGWGYDLAIDVFDHEPTEAEIADWLERRRKLSAALASPPTSAYLVAPNRAGKMTARKVSIRRSWERWGDTGRFDLDAVAGGEEIARVNLRELVERGSAPCDGGRRLYLKAPSQAEIEELERANRQRIADEEAVRCETRSVFDDLMGAFRKAPSEAPGAAALRSFGLDPSTATVAELQAAFRSRAVGGHSDQGGEADMGELVRQRDLAREHLEARG